MARLRVLWRVYLRFHDVFCSLVRVWLIECPCGGLLYGGTKSDRFSTTISVTLNAAVHAAVDAPVKTGVSSTGEKKRNGVEENTREDEERRGE